MASTTQPEENLVGAHVSAAGGIDLAVARLANIGGNVLQIFTGSPRVWAKPKEDQINEEKITAECQKYHVKAIFIHALYLINLASENPESLEKSVQTIAYDLRICAKIGAGGVVVHLGSHMGRGWMAVRDAVAETMRQIVASAPEKSRFLIENSAGQNGKLTSDLEDIHWLLDQVKSPRLGWCLDSCHAWAAGYSLGAKPGEALNVGGGRRLIDEITRLGLWESLHCVHINDSRDPFGSGRDRHANLLEGNISREEWDTFFADKRIRGLPKILEVPGTDDSGPDAVNIERLKELSN